MRRRAFPRDAIEANTARIEFGLDTSTYSKVATQLQAWRLGSAIYHSASELRRIIRESARYEPSAASQRRLSA